MPTSNPRITFTVSEDLMKQIDEYRFEHRLRNQTQAIVSLLNLGLEHMTGKKLTSDERFTEEQIELVHLFEQTDPVYQNVVTKIMKDNPATTQKNRA